MKLNDNSALKIISFNWISSIFNRFFSFSTSFSDFYICRNGNQTFCRKINLNFVTNLKSFCKSWSKTWQKTRVLPFISILFVCWGIRWFLSHFLSINPLIFQLSFYLLVFLYVELKMHFSFVGSTYRNVRYSCIRICHIFYRINLLNSLSLRSGIYENTNCECEYFTSLTRMTIYQTHKVDHMLLL